MPEFQFQEMFPLGPDDVPYRCLTSEYVGSANLAGERILTDDPIWSSWSVEALGSAAETARLVINPVIYDEVSIRFSRIEEVERALPRAMFQRESIPYEAAFLAGKVFVQYKRGGGAKTSPLPDFLHRRACSRRIYPADARFHAVPNLLQAT